jgi:hypothetical protein
MLAESRRSSGTEGCSRSSPEEPADLDWCSDLREPVEGDPAAVISEVSETS